VNHEREPARERWHVQDTAQVGGEHSSRESYLLVQQLEMCGRFIQPVDYGIELLAQLRKVLVARSITSATLDQPVHGALDCLGEGQGNPILRRCHRLQRQGADVISVQTQVDQAGFRAVRASKDVDLFIAHGLADFIQVVRKNRCGVLGQICLLLHVDAALVYFLQRKVFANDGLGIITAPDCALQQIRSAGASLVYQNYISLFSYLRDQLC